MFGKGSKLMLGRWEAALKTEREVEGKPGTSQTLVQPISLCAPWTVDFGNYHWQISSGRGEGDANT